VRISRTHFIENHGAPAETGAGDFSAHCARLRVLTDQVEAIALFPLETRLARLFLQLIAASGESGPVARIQANVTQAELAALIVASRSKVNKTLSHWRDTGLLKADPGYFVFDIDALKEISSLEPTSAGEWQEHTIPRARPDALVARSKPWRSRRALWTYGGTTQEHNGRSAKQVQEQCVPDGQRISVVIPEQVQWQAKTPCAGVKF
jgi:hypothetical protein